ncbi:non-homologous end-joining DNA ligase [Streptacidiphilus sp. PAMC 29251]
MSDHPGWVAPMLAAEGPLPTDVEAWATEVKWDGMRLVTVVGSDGTVRTFARSGADATARYPELAVLAAHAGAGPLVLDGEVVALDPATGLPSFGLLQQRMTLRQGARGRAALARVPVTLMVFDVLVHRGQDLTARSYQERREVLDQLPLAARDRIAVPPAWIGNVQAGLDWTREQRLEGVILKRLDSPYRPGERSPHWLKHKFRPTIEVVIGGWLADLTGRPRSLLVGTLEADGLRYLGAVGSGLSGTQQQLLLPLLTAAAAAASPFAQTPPQDPADIHWVHPLLQGEVQYAELTRGGHLRQPTWKALRGLASGE